MSAQLVIGKSEQNLLKCIEGPHLMPFHIIYSGPAPMTTFFRIQDADITGSSNPQLAEATNCGPKEEQSCTDLIEPVQSQERLAGRLSQHKVAAFRGRRIVGLETKLPENYSGLVLHGENSGQLREARKAKPMIKDQKGRKESSRQTRSTRKVGGAGIHDTIEQEDEEEQELSSTAPDGLIRRLHPSETFSSFTVWSPDIVVDEGQDEYMRALKEWFTVSSEVHKTEDDNQ